MSNKNKIALFILGTIIFLASVTVAKSYAGQIEELRQDLDKANTNYREVLKRNNDLQTDLEICTIKAKLFDALQKK